MSRAARDWLAVFVALLVALPAHAVTKDWNDGMGNWSEPTNWTPAGVPGAGDTVNIAFNDDVARTVTYDYTGPAITLGPLNVDMTGAGTNATTLSMAANTLTTGSGERIGQNGRGTFDQSGGIHTLHMFELQLGTNAGAIGTYNLSGTGSLVANVNQNVGIDGAGNINQSGGTNKISGVNNNLVLAAGVTGTGDYTLSGGTLSAGDNEYVGLSGIGIFNHSAGTNTVANTLSVGKNGSATGTYALSGTGQLTVNDKLIVGDNGNGTFAQTGGINKTGSLSVGDALGSTGSFTLSNGSLLSTVGESIGNNGSGGFGQTGGGHTSAGDINIGAFSGSSGNYVISGGTANAPNIFVGGRSAGPGGAGILTVTVSSSSVLNVNGTITVYNTPGTSLNLQTGTLNTSGINVNGTPSLFNWSGGTLHITNDVTWDSGAPADSTSRIFGSSLSLSSNRTLRVTGNETIGGLGGFNLSLTSNATHSVTGNITVKPGGTLSSTNTSNLSYGSLTQAGGTISGSLRNIGSFTHQSGTLSAFFVNAGTVSFGSSLTMSGGLSNETAMSVGSGQTLTIGGNGANNLGTFTLNGGALGSGPTFVNSVGGTLIAHGTITPSVNNQGTLIVDGLLSIGPSSMNSGILQGSGTLSTSFSSFSNSAGGMINSTNPGGTLVITNLQNNNAGGTMNVGPTSTLSITSNWTNSGVVNLQGAGSRLSGGTFTNNGTLQGFGTIAASIATSNNGVFRASGGELTFTGPSIFNSSQSQVQVLAGSTAMFLQGMLNNSGTISLMGGAFDNNNKTLLNQGTINGHGTLRTGGLTNSGTRLISVGGGDMSIVGSVINSGVVSIQSGRSAYFFGPVSGSGSFTGTGTAVFLASLSPGSSPASVSFAGGATLGGGTSLVMELGGTTAGSGYDRIQVAGELSIGGMLAVSLIGGFVPGAGTTFDILDWGTLSGTFSSLQLPALPSTYSWDTSQLYASGVLSVVGVGIPGDYNNNGVVDGADYVLWRKGGPLVNEVNTPGVVDAADYTEWRGRIGNTSGSSAGVSAETAAVPEPGTICLSMFVLAAAVLQFGRRR